MTKNFSVAWLSQSSQPDCRSGLETALVHSPAAPALQTKHPSHTGELLCHQNVKDVTKIPSSPTSKHSNSNTKVTGHQRVSENKPVRVFCFVINIFFLFQIAVVTLPVRRVRSVMTARQNWDQTAGSEQNSRPIRSHGWRKPFSSTNTSGQAKGGK